MQGLGFIHLYISNVKLNLAECKFHPVELGEEETRKTHDEGLSELGLALEG